MIIIIPAAYSTQRSQLRVTQCSSKLHIIRANHKKTSNYVLQLFWYKMQEWKLPAAAFASGREEPRFDMLELMSFRYATRRRSSKMEREGLGEPRECDQRNFKPWFRYFSVEEMDNFTERKVWKERAFDWRGKPVGRPLKGLIRRRLMV